VPEGSPQQANTALKMTSLAATTTQARSYIGLKMFEVKPYKAGATTFVYTDFKIGAVPDVEKVLESIAAAGAVNLSNVDIASAFVRALVAEFYVNGASDKVTAVGDLKVDGFSIDRDHIYKTLFEATGGHPRRFVRSFATNMVEIMRKDSSFNAMVDIRAKQLGINREQAYYAFDGAEFVAGMPPDVYKLLTRIKHLSISNSVSSTEYAEGMASIENKFSKKVHVESE